MTEVQSLRQVELVLLRVTGHCVKRFSLLKTMTGLNL